MAYQKKAGSCKILLELLFSLPFDLYLVMQLQIVQGHVQYGVKELEWL